MNHYRSERGPDLSPNPKREVIEPLDYSLGLEFTRNVGKKLEQSVVPVQISGPDDLGVDMDFQVRCFSAVRRSDIIE